MVKKFDRRSVLKLLGASSVGAMIPWVHTQSAKAHPDEVPLRILFLEVGYGLRRGTWEPDVGGSFDPAQKEVLADWAFRGPMSPLAPWRDRINIFQNLDMVSAKYDPTGGANAHIAGATHAMVADFRATEDLGGGVSIDQYIADEINKDGLVTRLKSLELMAVEHSVPMYAEIDYIDRYAVAGEKLPAIKHPPAAWNHIFPDPLDPDLEAQQVRVAKKTSAYNYIRGDYERLMQRLGTEDRQKIESMLDLRAELHEALTLFNSREANRPPESILDPYYTLDPDNYQTGSLDNRRWRIKTDLMTQLMAAALHTDTTRVGNLVLDNPPGYEYGYVPGTVYDGVTTTDWHDLTHKVSGDNPELTDAQARADNDIAESTSYETLAAYLELMESLPETDGQTMLDHTLIVTVSHIGEGSHDVTRLPWLTIGDAQGAMRTGNYVRFPIRHSETQEVGQLDYPSQSGDRIYWYRGRPHGDLFATLARAMGVDGGDAYGADLEQNEGYINEILT